MLAIACSRLLGDRKDPRNESDPRKANRRDETKHSTRKTRPTKSICAAVRCERESSAIVVDCVSPRVHASTP